MRHAIQPQQEQGDSIEVLTAHRHIEVAIHRAHTTEAIRLDAGDARELIDTLNAAIVDRGWASS